MNNATILEALQNATKAAVAASSVPALPIAFVDVTFNVPDDQKYVECVFIPNDPNDVCWGDEHLFQGLFRLILHWPKNGEGAYPPLNLISEITAYFSKRTLLQNVQIYDSPKLAGAIEGAGDTLYPASLRYQRFQG